MSKRDYYDVLGVARDAPDTELKKAYRRLAMKYHPDRNPDDSEAEVRFKEAKEAYEILGDPRKRASYDQFGHAGVDSGGGAGVNPGDVFGDIFGDMFSDIFGGGRRGRSNVYRGADLRYELQLDLEQAVFGDALEIDLPTLENCGTCDGSGARPGSSPVTCGTCQGAGQVRVEQGFFSIQQTCPNCRGSGQRIEDPCGDCRGHGRVQRDKTLSVKVPPGVDSGDRIRLTGEGEAGRNGGPPGDLYVDIRVRPHEIFERDGGDLSCEAPISFATAVFGGEINVPTLDGEVTLKVPSETQSGRLMRLRGKGVKPVRAALPGDLYVRLHVETPVRLTPKQKKLLEEFDAELQSGGDRHSPRSTSWLDGVRHFFEKLNT